MLQYYKFNLSHAALTTALLLEDNEALRSGYERGHAVLWRAVRHHRNAYFSLLRILMKTPSARAALAASKPSGLNPNLTVAEEIRSVLSDWIERHKAVKTWTGMPTGAVGDPKFQTELWPNNIGTFVGFDGSEGRLSTYALPIRARNGRDKDFVWQRDPFDTSYRGGDKDCRGAPPTEQEVSKCGGRPARIHPGVDYLLAYWLANYLKVLPAPAVPG